jgi:3',5'-cyclic AMP phosphodiesterase CpdA
MANGSHARGIGKMLIAHMSDLHCGPRLKKEMLQEAIDEINDMGPDIVVVTGDLTEEGLITESHACMQGAGWTRIRLQLHFNQIRKSQLAMM